MWLKRLLGGCVAVALVFLLGLNVLLQTRLLRGLISSNPAKIRLDYANAYSVFPGFIHVDGLSIRGRDGSLEWMLRLDHCDFWTSFFSLARRKFHARHVRGAGLSFRVRLRVLEAGPADVPSHFAALPPIEGFPFDPYKDPGPEKAPPTDAEYKLFGVQLDDVDVVQVREIWVDTLRIMGEMRVRGRWLFHPIRWLDVGPATVDIKAVSAFYGTRAVATALDGKVLATIHPFDVRTRKGVAVLDDVSTDIALRGHAFLANAADSLFPHGRVKFENGDGPIDVRLVTDWGVLLPGTRITTESRDAAVDIGDLAIAGFARASLEVRADGAEPPAAIGLGEWSNIGIAMGGHPEARVRKVAVTLRSRALRVLKPFDDAALGGEIRGAEASALGPWITAVTGMPAEKGAATLEADIEASVPDKNARGDVSFSVDTLSLNPKGVRASVTAKGHIRVDEASLQTPRLKLGSSRIDFRDLSARTGGVDMRADAASLRATGVVSMPRPGWDGRLAVNANTLTLRADREGQRPAVILPTLALETQRVTLGSGRMSGRVIVDMPAAEIPDVRGIAGLITLPRVVSLDRGAAHARLRATVTLPSGATDGEGRVDAGDLNVRIGTRSFAGAASLDLRAASRGESTVLSTTTFAFGSAPGFWTRVELTDSELRLGDEPAFRAALRATAKDASPVAAWLAATTPVPAWILGAVPLEDMIVLGDFRWDPAAFAIRSLAARGEGGAVELEFLREHETTRWATLIEAGVIHVGIRSDGGGPSFDVLAGQSWFGDQVSALRRMR